MTTPSSFHYQANIIRNTSNIIAEKEILCSTLEIFFDDTPTPFVSIGSSSKSSIIVDGALPTHCTFNFQENCMLIKSNGPTTIFYNDEGFQIGEGDLYTLDFNRGKIIGLHTLLECTIEIKPHVKIRNILSIEEGAEKETVENYLTDKYGSIQKLSESEHYLVYRTSSSSVVKMLHPYKNKEAFQVDQFFRAAREIEAINSDVVCKFKSGDNTIPHVELEYFPGETLQNYVAKKGRVGYGEAMLVLQKMAEFLQAANNSHYICKNLNLSNVLCGGEKKIKFVGWNTPMDDILLNTRYVLCLAPEYIRGDRATEASDIYSLGVIFYYLIAGNYPFKSAENYKHRISNNSHMTREELLSESSQITPQMSQLLEEMLSLDPEKRPSASEVLKKSKEIIDIKLWANIMSMEKNNIFYGLQIVSSVRNIQGEVCSLQDNKTFVIGRQADINIPGDTHMSRKHTEIILENGNCFLEDLGSNNGTKVMNEKIDKCQIDSGITFTIGRTTLCFLNYKKLLHHRKRLMSK